MRDTSDRQIDHTGAGSPTSGWLLIIVALTAAALATFLGVAYWPHTAATGVAVPPKAPATGAPVPTAPTPLRAAASDPAQRTEVLPAPDDSLCQTPVQARDLSNKSGLEPKSASGRIDYCTGEAGAFHARIRLGNLFPQSIYQLAFDGTPGLAGNEQLKQQCGLRGKEGYCDFRTVLTGGAGAVDETFRLDLPAGDYRVKLFVKNLNRDPRDEIVLFADELRFTVLSVGSAR